MSESGITQAEWKTLERAIYNDLLAGNHIQSYSIAGRSVAYSSQSRSEQLALLEFVRAQISITAVGGGFSLARFTNA